MDKIDSWQIKRWVGTQTYIGQSGIYTVMEGIVELDDGRQLSAWTMTPPSKARTILNPDGKTFGYVFESQPSTTVFEKPHIDHIYE